MVAPKAAELRTVRCGDVDGDLPFVEDGHAIGCHHEAGVHARPRGQGLPIPEDHACDAYVICTQQHNLPVSQDYPCDA